MTTNQDAPTTTKPDGTMEWRNAKGELHRDDDKPAIVYTSSDQSWYQHGKLHRDGDKPAIVRTNGDAFWFQHGKHHRDGDKPASICADGTLSWCRHGERHRDGDKPAVIYADGTQCWYQHGKLVRSGLNLSDEKSSAAKPADAEPADTTLEMIEKWRAAVRTMKAARSSILDAMDAEERR